MNATVKTIRPGAVITTSLLDILALLFVYFTPALSHLFNLPIYFLEPMRIMVILALAHTHRKNAYLLALTLPLFSFVVSAHPLLLKSLLITGELLFNVWFFYFIFKKINNSFAAIILSVVASKILYYGIKFILLSALLIEGSLISTPLFIQVIMTLVFGTYIAIFYRKKQFQGNEEG